MKNTTLFLILFFLFTLFSLPQQKIELVEIEKPEAQLIKKRTLLINTEDILGILKGIDTQNLNANIEFATMEDYVIARLGKIKKGNISWSHKITDGKFLSVKYGKSDFSPLLKKIEERSGRPGYQIIISDIKSNSVIKSFEITFSQFPNLKVELNYPVNIAPGELLKGKITISAENTGTADSGDFDIDLILSKEYNFAFNKYLYSEDFKDVSLMKNGNIKVKSIPPGKKTDIEVTAELTLHKELPNGRYYIGAIIDPSKKIPEIDEEDNIFRGFIMIAPKEPKVLKVLLPSTVLTYNPKTFALSVKINNMDISISKEWRKCNIRPCLYQIKHASWKDYFWEIDTDEKTVWKITGAQFCKRGGTAKKLNIKVKTKGGSSKTAPQLLSLQLSDTRILYEPKTRKFKILCSECQIAHTPFWKTCKIEPLKYHFKFVAWDNFSWEIDPVKSIFKKIPQTRFCKKGEEGEKLDLKIETEY